MSLAVCSTCGFEMFIPHCASEKNYVGICAPCLYSTSEINENSCRLCDTNIASTIYHLKRKLNSIKNINLSGKPYTHLSVALESELIPLLQNWQLERNAPHNIQHQTFNPFITPTFKSEQKQVSNSLWPISSNHNFVNMSAHNSSKMQKLTDYRQIIDYSQILAANQVLDEPLDYELNLKNERKKAWPYTKQQMQQQDNASISSYSSCFDQITKVNGYK